MMLRLSRSLPLAMATAATVIMAPSWAHHPFEGVEPQQLSFAQGLVSGLAHPLLGTDHLVFLLAIVVMALVTTGQWVIPLLASGLVCSALAVMVGATPGDGLSLALELVVTFSLIAAGLAQAGWLSPGVLLPFMGVHGFLLGETMIGAEPTPLLAYGLGLLLSQGTLLIVVTALLAKSKAILAMVQGFRLPTTILLVSLGVIWTGARFGSALSA